MIQEHESAKAEGTIAERIEKEETKGHRKLSGPFGIAARIIAVLLPIYSFLFIMDLFEQKKQENFKDFFLAVRMRPRTLNDFIGQSHNRVGFMNKDRDGKYFGHIYNRKG